MKNTTILHKGRVGLKGLWVITGISKQVQLSSVKHHHLKVEGKSNILFN